MADRTDLLVRDYREKLELLFTSVISPSTARHGSSAGEVIHSALPKIEL